jgi:putative ABC transport system permease protein
LIADLLYRARAIFRRTTVESELDEELRFHLEHQIETYVHAGLSRQEAERRARLEFGGVEQVKEETRDARGVAPLDTLLRDIRYGLRVLRKSPSFTSVAVLSLVLGIGANAAIFQVLDSIRLRSLPVANPHELAEVRIQDMNGVRGSVNRENSLTYGLWEQIRDRQQAFSSVFAWSDDMLNLSPAGEVRMARGLWVSGAFFSALGVEPVAGRLIAPSDDRPGCGTPGAVISHAFWHTEFGADPAVVGRKLTLNGRPVEIMGVAPPGFFGVDVGRVFQVALPICSVPEVRGFDALHAGTFWWLTVMGRLKPGWTVERASANLNSISSGVFQASLPANYPAVSVKTYLAMNLTALPAAAGLSGLRNRYADSLWMLLAVAGLVLLIACANLAGLMLARASARGREIAVRLAIGASRGRLIRQLMTESLLIAAAGAGLGLLFSLWLSRLLVTLLTTDERSINLDLHPDWRVLCFTAGLAVLTCLFFGLAPALQATQAGPGAVLKSAARGVTADRGRFSLRRLLLAAQVALSVVLLVGALLFVRSLHNLLTVETGFRSDGVLIADLRFARANPAEVNVLSFQKSLLARIQGVPGVVSVADTSIVPVSGSSWSNKAWLDGTDGGQVPESLHSFVSSGYFRTLALPLLAGRDFAETDTPQSPKVAIVNQAFAQRIANTANPVGLRFRVEPTPSTPETVYEIVGLVGNAKYRSLREDFKTVFYLPFTQDPHPSLSDQLLIRSSLPSSALVPAVRAAISEVDPKAHFDFEEFQAQIDESLLAERLMAALSSALGVLAGLLSAAGLYGGISYMVARRRSEVGIRMALGADRRAVLALFLRESGMVLAWGLSLGGALALAAATAASSMLFGLKPYDAATFAAALGLLALVALVATYLPARRAAGIDPLLTLRDD